MKDLNKFLFVRIKLSLPDKKSLDKRIESLFPSCSLPGVGKILFHTIITLVFYE